MNAQTKVYIPRTCNTPTAAPACHVKIGGLTDAEISAEVDRIRNLRASPGMNPRLPLCLIIDLSGSMSRHTEMIKKILREMIEQLQLVQHRDYTLDLIVIHNGSAKTVYYGDVKNIVPTLLIDMLPEEPFGTTPYADALSIGSTHMDTLYRAMECAGQWYNPAGVILCVTDCENNMGNGADITARLAKEFVEGKRIITEFVTMLNEKGLCPGGYKVFIDQTTSTSQVNAFMKALRVGSSTVQTGKGDYEEPDCRKREKWNQYLADRLIAEIAASYDRCIKPSMSTDE